MPRRFAGTARWEKKPGFHMGTGLGHPLFRTSLTCERAGTRSQMTLTETRIGTDNKAPGTPQSQVQKIRETKMTTGLRVKRRPSKTGVTRFDSRRWSTKYQAGGRRPFQSVSKVSRPT